MKRRILEAFVFSCALVLRANAQGPVITSQPQSITINNASTATFTLAATNAATFQWQFNGNNIAGATNATLTYDDVATNQAGFYSVVVTSSAGLSTNSQPAQLTIVPGSVVQVTFSGFPDGSSSNVILQLFDHDKPATVENFLNYVASGAYSNLFFERDIPNFVLQAGDYAAADRTANPLDIGYISRGTNNFSSEVDNESHAGPLIRNAYGTIAMTLVSGEPDSASGAFYFNLADNSANLDNESGGFTVFGRVVSGSNVLQYFNTLSKPNQGIFDETTASANASLTDLPVNYQGWTSPANSNLFFGDFTLLSPFNADTNLPTIVVNFPTNGQTMTNADVVLQGAASDDVAVANVNVILGFNSVHATGTTNWSADTGVLSPGQYSYFAVAQNGAGKSSAASYGAFTVPRFPFTNSVTGNGTLSTNRDGTNTTVGQSYTLTAKPGKGAVFANWTSGASANLNPTLNFTMRNGMQITATFISNTMPSLASFTYPSANSQVAGQTFSIKGKAAAGVGSVQIACQIYSASSGNSVSTNIVLNTAAGAWSTPSLTFAPGDYTAQVIALAAGGRAKLMTENFTVLAQLTIIKYGLGKIDINNGAWLQIGREYWIDAIPVAGKSSFLSWNGGSGSYPQAFLPFIMSDGLTLTATFVSNTLPDKLTFTSPTFNARVTSPNVILGGKITYSGVAPQVACQLFENGAPLTGFMPATVTATGWTLPVTNLTMGAYNAVAMATDASGRTAMASDLFSANFYPSIAGTYNGLFIDPAAISETNAGYISFTLSGSGVASGNLKFPLQTCPFSIDMGSSGSATKSGIKGPNGTLSLALSFDVTNLSGQMTGSVTQGSEVCPIRAYRAVTKLSASTAPAVGNYVLSLQPATFTNGPAGDSFAAVKVSASGTLAVAGAVADNTTFSQSTGVFTNGVWPLYASCYQGRGMLIGWETNLPSGACSGSLFWSKSPGNGVYYTGGLDEELNSAGAKYVPPGAGVKYQIVFAGGTLTSSVTNTFFCNAAGTMVAASGTTDQLKGSLVLSTGVLKGSILNPFSHQTLNFNGAFISPAQGGGGFTLDTGGQTGYFEISPAP